MPLNDISMQILDVSSEGPGGGINSNSLNLWLLLIAFIYVYNYNRPLSLKCYVTPVLNNELQCNLGYNSLHVQAMKFVALNMGSYG